MIATQLTGACHCSGILITPVTMANATLTSTPHVDLDHGHRMEVGVYHLA